MRASFVKILLNHIIMLLVFGLFIATLTKTAYGEQVYHNPPQSLTSNYSNTENSDTKNFSDTAFNESNSPKQIFKIKQTNQRVLGKIKQRRTILLTKNTQKRFTAVNNRLQKIAGRIASRLSKMEKRGFDTTELRSDLDTVFENLRRINKNISTINDNYINQTFTGNQVIKNWTTLKINLKSIKTDLIAVKKQMLVIALKMKTGTKTTNN